MDAVAARPRPTRRIVAAVAAVLLASAVGVLTPATAEASSSATCPSGYACFYYNSNYQGARADLYFSDSKLNNEYFNDGPRGASGWGRVVGNDSASLWNRTGSTLRVYDKPGCTGPVLSIVPGAKVNLGPIGWKNRISSIYIADGRGACQWYDQAGL